MRCRKCKAPLFEDSLEKEKEWIDKHWGEARCYPHQDPSDKHEPEEVRDGA